MRILALLVLIRIEFWRRHLKLSVLIRRCIRIRARLQRALFLFLLPLSLFLFAIGLVVLLFGMAIKLIMIKMKLGCTARNRSIRFEVFVIVTLLHVDQRLYLIE